MTMTMVNNISMLRRKLLLGADNHVFVHIDYLCDRCRPGILSTLGVGWLKRHEDYAEFHHLLVIILAWAPCIA